MKNATKRNKPKGKTMNNPTLCINHELSEWKEQIPDIDKQSLQIADMVFKYLDSRKRLDFLPQGKPVNIGLTLTGDREIHHLNQEFRGIDKPTNVLSFAALDDEDFAQDAQIYDEVELGDIIIAYETMEKEAKEKNISLHDHYCHLLIHGLLHLSGFDHQSDEEADEMEGIEIEILHQLNIANPYTE